MSGQALFVVETNIDGNWKAEFATDDVEDFENYVWFIEEIEGGVFDPDNGDYRAMVYTPEA